MTKKVIAGSLALLAVTAMYAQTYQLPNVGFENWEKAKGILWTEKNKNQGQHSQERNLNLGILQISNLLQDGLAPTKNLSRKKATMEKPMLMS